MRRLPHLGSVIRSSRTEYEIVGTRVLSRGSESGKTRAQPVDHAMGRGSLDWGRSPQAPVGARWGMTRTHDQPSFPSRNCQRAAVFGERARVMRDSPTQNSSFGSNPSAHSLRFERVPGEPAARFDSIGAHLSSEGSQYESALALERREARCAHRRQRACKLARVIILNDQSANGAVPARTGLLGFASPLPRQSRRARLTTRTSRLKPCSLTMAAQCFAFSMPAIITTRVAMARMRPSRRCRP